MSRIKLQPFYIASLIHKGKRVNVAAMGIGIYMPSDNEDMKMTKAGVELLARHIHEAPESYWTETGFKKGSQIIECVFYSKGRTSVTELLGAKK